MPVQRLHSRSFRLRTVLLASALPLLALGCAHDKAAQQATVPGQDDPELAKLRRENAVLRDRVHNLEERVRMLEREGVQAHHGDGYERYGSIASESAPSWEADDLDGPRQLPVVKLTPTGKSIERPEPEPEPAAKRGRGSIALSPVPHSGAPAEYAGGYVVDARGNVDYDEYDDREYAAADDASADGQPASYRLVGSKLVQATKRKSSATPSRSSDRDRGVIKDYDRAMKLYRDGRYAEAEQAFAAIVSAHPNHDYADNALYWQGEAAYDQAHYADALASFTKVVERYGGGNKAPDALLKIGLCYGRLGDHANARDVLTQLIAAYPSTNASKIAKRKLAELED